MAMNEKNNLNKNDEWEFQHERNHFVVSNEKLLNTKSKLDRTTPTYGTLKHL